MKLFQMPQFKRYVKKLPRQFQQVILDTVEEVLANPKIGQLKKGDLEGFRVHKFTMGRQLTLIAYKVENDSLVLYQVGSHENFYKNLKRYLKEIGG
ncbi:MAG: type II toxin-antitoxin system RelE/ParE family toxin [Deltaproteobacteria bacterium]|nr:type II toxin-antitoxin system RelE/ParE family toxin [Deltaproteobacteria bacterium]